LGLWGKNFRAPELQRSPAPPLRPGKIVKRSRANNINKGDKISNEVDLDIVSVY